MRNTKCLFCDSIFNDKHKYCEHVALKHNDQIPEECDPLEFAYSLLTHKDIGRKCVICHQRKVHFNDETLKYERICDNPKCKEEYVRIMKERMKRIYGHEHMLNDPDTQRNMIKNHPYAKDFVWDDKHTFRVIGSYEYDFLDHLKQQDWSPNDVFAPSPNNYFYKQADGTTHLYIPDFYIPSMSLEIEIKDGDNTHSRMENSRDIERRKDEYMYHQMKQTAINYIKIIDKNYDEFDEIYVKSDTNKPE